MNRVTNSMIESENIRIDEFIGKKGDETRKKLDEYSIFVYV